MSLGKNTGATPEDPIAIANAQTASNKQTATANAELNRVNTSTPYGDLTYNVSGTNPDGTPIYSSNVALSPQEQGLFDTNTANQQSLATTASGLLGQIQSAYQTPQTFQNDIAPLQKQAQDAAYKSATQYLDPQFEQAGRQLDTKLANEGVVQGSNAASEAQNNLALQKQSAYGSAQNAAIGQGNQEQQTLFNQMFALQNQPLNEYSALASGSQVQNPSFQSVPTATQANTDIAGINSTAFNQQLQAANYSNQGINNLFSLGGQLGSAAILAG